MTAELRVLTLNLLSPEHADWDRRRPVLADRLHKLRPDLVAFDRPAGELSGGRRWP